MPKSSKNSHESYHVSFKKKFKKIVFVCGETFNQKTCHHTTKWASKEEEGEMSQVEVQTVVLTEEVERNLRN